MKCKICNTENNNENKYCKKCGSELKPGQSDITFCPSCGCENTKAASLCENCGSKLQRISSYPQGKLSGRKQGKSKKNKPEDLRLSKVIREHKVISAAIIILLGFLVYQSIPKTVGHNDSYYEPAGVKGSIVSIMSDSISAAVVKSFDCSCGDCNDSLEVCTCSKAAEERTFIQRKAAQKLSVEGIITAVNNKYGGLKVPSELIKGG